VEQLEGGDRLLFVTDGVLEARQRRRFFTAADGEFFDATGVAGAAFQGRDLATGLDVVVQRMTDWTRGRLRDDAALLAIEIPPTR
jgi:serine phosphatase RsbU (regulator of sigma subunit)